MITEMCHTTQDAKKRRKQNRRFLDALTSFDFKLSVSQSVTYRFFTASASTGLSDFFYTPCSIANIFS